MLGQRRALSFAPILIVVSLAACSQPSPTVPSAPPLVVTPVNGITINGLPSSVSIGQSIQLTASVVLPDGTQKQTLDATWQSSDATVATISTTGMLNFVGSGPTDVTASAYGQSTSAHVRVPFRISGVVHESAPTADVAVADARVDVQGGTDAGKSTTTDNSGHFALDVGASGFSLVVTKSGYDSTVAAIEMLPRDQHPTIELTPDGQLAHTLFTGNLCTIAGPSYWSTQCTGTDLPYPVQTHDSLPVHRPGIATVAVSYLYIGDYYPNSLSLAIRCGDQLITEKDGILPSTNSYAQSKGLPDMPTVFQITLPRACSYEFSLFNFIADLKDGNWTTYRVEVDHPK